MNLPANPRDLSRLLVAVTDLHPDNDLRVRHDATQEALSAAGLIRWSGSPKRPGWKLTEAGAEIVQAHHE
jgi:hypothetical protein